MSVAPTGTVTFLFTDIEGSTRLWEQHPDAMRPALARHEDLLRGCIEQQDGYVFKTVGDAFCAAFPTANQALEAALAAQLALTAKPWETQTPLRVRMALHTGATEERGGDYFGQPLNRVARLMAAGHGGQTLLSEVTQALVRDALPPNASLRDLSRHRLKDLGQPEQVFQLLHPALPADFPPLRSLDSPTLPNNLPQQPTSFIGREKQVEEVKALLAGTPLLTLTGAGGSGKTRLSLHVAADLLDGDGVWLVELAALADPALVPQAVANVLGVKEQAGKSIQGTLVEALKTKRLLLVLDNCEHLIEACASLAADLLRSCPGVHLLASSREALNVTGEQIYRVPSLSLPDPKRAQTVESLSQFEAVRLFIERARAVQPSFAVTDENASAVTQVCLRLDGIPLAIELAAARVRSLSVEEVNTRLDQRFRLLTGGARNALPRQQTLRALIDWSYDLLTPPEKTLLCRLSVFAGGWTLAAAEGVCSGGAIEDFEVLDLLTGLADKSLAVYEGGAEGGAGRYRLLESVRQYAGDRLGERGEAEAVQGRAASWFLALAEEAEPQLRGPEQASWLGRLEAEHDNLRASLAWEERRAEGGEDGLRLVGALWLFWWVRGHFTEGRQWLGRALARTTPGAVGLEDAGVWEASAARAKALDGSGHLARMQGDYADARALYGGSLALSRRLGDQPRIAGSLNNLGLVASEQGDYTGARALYEESLTILRQLGGQQRIALSLINLGMVAFNRGDYAGARALYEESLTILRPLGDQQGIALSLTNLGNVAWGQGDYAGARAMFEESLTIQRQLGDQWGIAGSLINLGEVARYQGDYAGAQALYEEGLTILRPLGEQRFLANALGNLGMVASAQGDYAAARALMEESLTIRRQLRDQSGIAGSLEDMAIVAQGQSQPSRAARFGGAASALRESIGSPRPPAFQEEADKTMASAREALGEDTFAAAWDAGQAMSWEQAVEYALAGTDGDAEPSGTPSGPSPAAPS